MRGGPIEKPALLRTPSTECWVSLKNQQEKSQCGRSKRAAGATVTSFGFHSRRVCSWCYWLGRSEWLWEVPPLGHRSKFPLQPRSNVGPTAAPYYSPFHASVHVFPRLGIL